MNRFKEIKAFSWMSFWVGGIVHFAISALLPFLAFGAAMSAFNKSNAKESVDSIMAFTWLWCPIPMVANNYFGITYEKGLVLVFLIWSLIVAVGLGFLVPYFKGR